MWFNGLWLPYPVVLNIERNIHTIRLKDVHEELLTKHALAEASRELDEEYLDWYRLNYLTYYGSYFDAISRGEF